MSLHVKVSDATRSFITRRHTLLIGNDRAESNSGRRFDVRDPGTGAVVATVAQADETDIDRAVRAARAAFENPVWRDMKPVARAEILLRFADLIEANADLLAELETTDNGAPIGLTRYGFVALALNIVRYYAGWPTKLVGETLPLSADGEWHAYTVPEPVGVVAQIVPWNAPSLAAMQKVAPALAAGCTIVLKPSELTPLSALKFGELALEAGIPPGVLNVVTGFGDAGAALVNHPLVDKISFTGSTETGKSIMRAAASSLKRISLELGGKSPAIIFPDADLERAIPGVANAIFMNSGQVCAAASRLFVHRKVHDKVIAGIAEIADNMQIGHGFDDGSVIGPLISERQREKVLGYVAAGQAAGAELVTGGTGYGEGYYVKPTVFTSTKPDMSIIREEIFGPVISAAIFDDDDDLDKLCASANDCAYGLAASIWTRDMNIAHKMTRKLHSGQVCVNVHAMLDVALPFGGVKQSGLGRENGKEGILAYTELKSVAYFHG